MRIVLTTLSSLLKKIRYNYSLSVISVIGFFLLLAETAVLPWYTAFIKSGSHQVYLLSFHILFALSMPAMKKIKIKNISICLIYGVIFGLLISATSILIMGIVEGGISVWINSLKHHGSHTLGVLLFGPFVLGAWLVGALILLSIKLLYIDE